MTAPYSDALKAIQLAKDGRKVLLAVPDRVPSGKIFLELSRAIQDEGVHGFQFFEGKLYIQHGSGGSIKITCEKHILDGTLGGLLFHELIGKEQISRHAIDLAMPYVRLRANA